MLRTALSATILAFITLPSLAHVTLEKTTATAGSGYKAIFRVGHGCENSPTVTLKVRIPEGMIAAKPMPKPGWTLTVTKSAYSKTYDYYGKPMSEGAREISWSGSLPDDHYDEFVINAYVPKETLAGAALYFPVEQICEKGAHNWVEIPVAGQDSHALKDPAPFIRIAAPEGQKTPSPLKAGALSISHVWLREPPPAAKVAGGYLTVTNEGSTADRLLAVEGDAAATVEVHEMSNVDGVMRMQAISNGLPIEPGQTIELKPGGYHVMFMGLKRPLKSGETVPATLVFEKAGRVAVTFGVESARPGAEEHKH